MHFVLISVGILQQKVEEETFSSDLQYNLLEEFAHKVLNLRNSLSIRL